MTSLGSGNRKTRVFGQVVKPLEEYEDELAFEMGGEIAERESDYKILQARLPKAQQDAAKA